MGVRLVGEVMAYAVGVPLRFNEYRLLVSMALTALDPDDVRGREAAKYFDSREAMALAIGRLVPDPHDESSGCACDICLERRAAFQVVKTAVSGLIKLGAIRQVRRGKAGQRAEYQVVLDKQATRSSSEFRRRQHVAVGRAEAARETALSRYDRRTEQGTSDVPNKVRPTYRSGTTDVPPRNNRNNQEQKTGTTSVNGTVSLGRNQFGHLDAEAAVA